MAWCHLGHVPYTAKTCISRWSSSAIRIPLHNIAPNRQRHNYAPHPLASHWIASATGRTHAFCGWVRCIIPPHCMSWRPVCAGLWHLAGWHSITARICRTSPWRAMRGKWRHCLCCLPAWSGTCVILCWLNRSPNLARAHTTVSSHAGRCKWPPKVSGQAHYLVAVAGAIYSIGTSELLPQSDHAPG